MGVHRTSDAADLHSTTVEAPLGNKDKVPGEQLALIQQEERAEREVKFGILWAYIKAAGHPIRLPITVTWSMVSQGLVVLTSVWLAFWVGDRFPNLTTGQYIGIYIGLTLLSTLLPFGYAALIVLSCTKAANKLSKDALNSVLRAPVRFFDSQPTGRILSRFSKDGEFQALKSRRRRAIMLNQA